MSDMSYLAKLPTMGQLSDEDLATFKASVVELFDAADEQNDLDAMSAAADALDQITATQSSRAGDVTNDVENLGTTAADTDSANAGDAAATPQTSVPPLAASAAEGDDEESDDEDGAMTAASDTEPTEGDEPEADEEETDETPDGDEAAEEATDAPAEGDASADASADGSVTAGGKIPPSFKAHEFKKKGAKPAADDTSDDSEEDDEDDAMTAAASENDSEDKNVAVEQKDLPAERAPLVAAATPAVVVAGADIPGVPSGIAYADEAAMNEAFVRRLGTVRNARGMDGDKIIVASVESKVIDERRLLETGADASNAAKINDVVRTMKKMGPGNAQMSITASGGYCAPLEVRYDIFGLGVTDRPIRDSLAGFQATRGGITYVQPPILSSFSGAVGLWTAANDANPSSPATKPFLTAVCQNAISVTADAVTLEIQFGNLMTRAYPELVARNNELGLIYQARFAEQTLLSKIAALSTAVSSTWVLGTARDFLNSVGRLAAAYRTRSRMEHDDALRCLAPSWVLDAMREDLTRGAPAGMGDSAIEWADATINAAMAARNVNITWYIDDALFTGVQATGPINDFPAKIVYYLFAEGTFLFLDGGTLDLGIVRDSTLVGTNDYRMFVETFEGVAKVGIESIQATVTTHITGANVGTVTPS